MLCISLLLYDKVMSSCGHKIQRFVITINKVIILVCDVPMITCLIQ